uniref:Uncharacterized protein n=1 Tax=Panagrolaimus superbus TaxID=310955 RepID=A0A914YLF1_9BILA
MFENVYFCGFRVWKWAKVIAFIGILNSLLTFILMLISWLYVPLSLVAFSAYTSLLIGIKFKRLNYLRFAEIILGINAFINLLLDVATISIEIFVPNDEIIHFIDDYGNHSVENNLHAAFIITELIILIQVAFAIFSFIIVHKTRLYFTFTYPYGYCTTPKRQTPCSSKSSSMHHSEPSFNHPQISTLNPLSLNKTV